jgi:hypothetical protein
VCVCVCWRAAVEQSDSSRLRLLLACRPCRLVPTAHCRVIVHRIDKRPLLRVGAQGEQPCREVAHSLRCYSLKSIANPRGKGRCTQRYLFSGRSSRLHSAGARGVVERGDACVRTTRRRRGTREGEYSERVGTGQPVEWLVSILRTAHHLVHRDSRARRKPTTAIASSRSHLRLPS